MVGHLLAILAAIRFAYSTSQWWGGLLIALGVIGNHTADCIDGNHARATGQCRNGGELLDHFTNPLSFAYWLVGLAISCNQPYCGLVAVICLYALAVLINLKAKMSGEFTLSQFGPTEFKTLLSIYGLCMSASLLAGQDTALTMTVAHYFLGILIVIGVIQLVTQLWLSVQEVNQNGTPPGTSEWITTASRPNEPRLQDS